MIAIPHGARSAAQKAYTLRKQYGFQGGTSTGWKRAHQLVSKNEISIQDLRYMHNWFVRHRYTSFPSYEAWKKAGSPVSDSYWHHKRGIIAWLIWGGDAAYRWVTSDRVMRLLNKN